MNFEPSHSFSCIGLLFTVDSHTGQIFTLKVALGPLGLELQGLRSLPTRDAQERFLTEIGFWPREITGNAGFSNLSSQVK